MSAPEEAVAASASACHVVVIGAGLAGLAAAISAADAGARVTILEKEKTMGGNSAKATSGMNAVGSAAQLAREVQDSEALFFHDTMRSGHNVCDPSLVRMLAAGSADVVEWLRGHGVALDAVTLCGGHSVARTHHEAPRADGKPSPVGWDIIAALRKVVEARADKITIRTHTRAVELLQDTKGWTPDHPRGVCPVTGVRVVHTGGNSVTLPTAAESAAEVRPSAPEDIPCDAVVLATGGFGNDHTATSLLSQYAPQLACLPTTNGAFAQGDGVKIARAAGAALRDMEFVQVHPTGLVDPADPHSSTKFLGPEALRGVGGIMLNHRGQRFVNELTYRDAVSEAMFRCCTLPGSQQSAAERGDATVTPAPVVAYLVMTPAAAARFGPNFTFYHKVKHFFAEVDGAAGLAEAIGPSCRKEDVRKALDTYASAARGAQPDEFGKTAFPDTFDGAAASTLFVARVTPSIHYTMGGVAMNASAEMLYSDASEVEREIVMELASGTASRGASTTTGVAASPVALSAEEAAQTHNLTATRSSLDLKAVSVVDGSDAVVGLDHNAGFFEQPIKRPIPRLFGAGEVSGGVHGGNRLAGNSLLECAVFGRIAGARAASVASSGGPALRADGFVPLRFRESLKVCTAVYLFRFDLPSPLHHSGLAAGEYIAVRAVINGAEVVRFYSPISRSDALGHLDLLLKIDDHGGAMTTFINGLRPGATLEFKGPIGGVKIDLRPGADMGRVKRIGLVCGGTGLAPMAQILRSAFFYNRTDVPIKMLYAAASPDQLAYLPLLRRKTRLHPHFELFCAVERAPPDGSWTEVRAHDLRGVLAHLYTYVCRAARGVPERAGHRGTHVPAQRRPAHRYVWPVPHVCRAQEGVCAHGVQPGDGVQLHVAEPKRLPRSDGRFLTRHAGKPESALLAGNFVTAAG